MVGLLRVALGGACKQKVAQGLDFLKQNPCQTLEWNAAFQDAKGLRQVPAYWLERMAQLPRRTHVELAVYWDQVAKSLTNQLRMGRFGAEGRDQWSNEWRADARKEALAGDELRTTICFAVNMSWLALSTVLTAMTLIVLEWTVWHGAAKGEVVWKSSILPLVYYCDRMVVVQREDGAVWVPEPETVPLMGYREMEKDARKLRVRFSPDDN